MRWSEPSRVMSTSAPPCASLTVMRRVVEPRSGEVADHLDGVAAIRALIEAAIVVVGGHVERIDGDLLDVVELADHHAVAGDDDLGVRVQIGEAGRDGICPGIDHEGLRRVVAGDEEAVAVGTVGAAVDDVTAVRCASVVGVPHDRVVAVAGQHDVVAGAGVERRVRSLPTRISRVLLLLPPTVPRVSRETPTLWVSVRAGSAPSDTV